MLTIKNLRKKIIIFYLKKKIDKFFNTYVIRKTKKKISKLLFNINAKKKNC